MIGRDIQRIEVVPLIFDLRTMGHFKAHTAEDVQDGIHRGGNGMATSATGWQTGFGGIQKRGRRACLFQVGFPLLEGPFQTLLDFIGSLSRQRLLLFGDVFHHAHDTFEGALGPQMLHPPGFKAGGILDRRQRGQG